MILDEERNNEGFIEKKLEETFQEKLSERREFRKIIEQFRYTNTDLYQKMATAGESRSNALFNKKAKWKLALVLPNGSTPGTETAKADIATTKSPMFKPKAPKKSKFVKKGKVLLGKKEDEKIELGTVEDVMDENDDVIQSLKWARDILLKETEKRKKIRAQKRSLKRRAGKKLQTLWTFHHQKEASKKAKSKKIKEENDSKNVYTNLDRDKDDDTKQEDAGALIDDIKMVHNDPDPFDDEEEDEVHEKRKTIIINLQKRLSFKKASRFANRVKREEKTEEEKLKDAQKHLEYLQEKQKQNTLVDFFGVPRTIKVTKEGSTAEDSNESESRKESTADSQGPSRIGSIGDEEDSKPVQCK